MAHWTNELEDQVKTDQNRMEKMANAMTGMENEIEGLLEMNRELHTELEELRNLVNKTISNLSDAFDGGVRETKSADSLHHTWKRVNAGEHPKYNSVEEFENRVQNDFQEQAKKLKVVHEDLDRIHQLLGNIESSSRSHVKEIIGLEDIESKVEKMEDVLESHNKRIRKRWELPRDE